LTWFRAPGDDYVTTNITLTKSQMARDPRPTAANDAWDQTLWETFVCTTLGKKHGMDLFGDHTSTCTAHSGTTKTHDWAV
jgi:hypothetical protein